MEKQQFKLTNEVLEEIKADLLEQMKRLENDLKQYSSGIENDMGDALFPDFGDSEDEHTSGVVAFSDNLSLEYSLKKSLKDVKKALQRIEDNTYGHCKYCNAIINPLRLKARPASGSCVECKVKLKGR